MALERIIKEKLQNSLNPMYLELVNESYKHKGHAGDDGSGESHWSLVIVSDSFIGENRVQRQRSVMGALKAEMAGRIHALSMKCFSPDEYDF